MTVLDLFDMVDRYMDANEAVEWNRMVDKGHTLPQLGMEGSNKKEFKKLTKPDDHKGKAKNKSKSKPAQREVIAIEQCLTYNKGNGPLKKSIGRSTDQSFSKGYNTTTGNGCWHPFHSVPCHDLHNYHTWQKCMDDFYSGKGPMPIIPKGGVPNNTKDADGDEQKAYQKPDNHVNVIFGGSTTYPSKRQFKSAYR